VSLGDPSSGGAFLEQRLVPRLKLGNDCFFEMVWSMANVEVLNDEIEVCCNARTASR
jgi:hypothetical protein